MPFDNERANLLGHVGIVSDDGIRHDLDHLAIDPQSDGLLSGLTPCHISNLEDGSDLPKKAIAIDGSRAESKIDHDRNVVRIGFIEVSIVDVDLAELRAVRDQPTVRPTLLYDTTSVSHTRIALPSENTHYRGLPPQPRGWRMMLYHGFKKSTVYDTSLLAIYRMILEDQDEKLSDLDSEHVQSPLEGGKVRLLNCPNPECGAQELYVPLTGTDECRVCGIETYPTDRLRIHERVNNNQPNLGALNNTMEVVVHLALAAAIQSVHNDPDRDLAETVIMKDGPLAQFDTSKWVSRPMLAFIERVRAAVDEVPPIVGLHKSGEFVAFADRLRDEIPPQTVVPLTTKDISDYVKEIEINRTFGQREYYGKNFVYKSESGYMFALTVPRRMETIRDVQSDPAAYPSLERVLRALDDTELTLYNDSVGPIHLAHDAATIPDRVGSKVLRELVEAEVIGTDRLYD